MKKKKLINNMLMIVGLLVLAFVTINITIYVIAGKNILNYFIVEEENVEVWDMLKKDGEQSVVIDDYIITLEEYLYAENAYKGCAVFSVKRDDYDMRDEFGNDSVSGEFYSPFGEDGRFSFSLLSDISNPLGDESRYEKKKDVMYVYYEFDIDMNYKFNGEILLYDDETDGTYKNADRKVVYRFKLEDAIKYKMYELEYGEETYNIYITPFELKIVGNNSIKQINYLILYFENSKIIQVIDNEQMNNEKYCIEGKGIEGHYYSIWFDKVINVDKLKEIEVNGIKIKTIND